MDALGLEVAHDMHVAAVSRMVCESRSVAIRLIETSASGHKEGERVEVPLLSGDSRWVAALVRLLLETCTSVRQYLERERRRGGVGRSAIGNGGSPRS